MTALRLTPLLILASAAFAQQQPQQRDLRVEKIGPPTAAPKAPSIPRSYAVIVGISRYKNLPPELQLQYAERDADSIHSILISPEGGNFKAENVHILAGGKATLAGMRQEIANWLPTQAKEDDRVLIFFAGHGFMYQGKGYLAPYDFDRANIAATGFPMDELGAIVGGKIKAKAKILFTDACHSGAITPEDTQAINNKLTGLQPSLFSLTASRDREQSFESGELEGGHGVFTYYVVKGLEGEADLTPRDGIVTADELAEYVHTQVRDATKGKQNPTSDKGSYDAQMLLSYLAANAPPAASPAPKFGTLTFESNMDNVELYLDEKLAGVLSKGKPFTMPGLQPGAHTVKGVRMGYEPDGPREETVYPGQESTVSIKILIARRRPKAAVDLLDKGLQYYQNTKGDAENYRKAADNFEQALKADPTYSQAAFYLGLTYNALFEQDKAQEYYKKAIEIDPDYLEARANYGGMLLDVGKVDESIRQFTTVLQRQPKHAVALTLVAQAYRFKELFPQSIEAARKAIALTPKNAEPHMWLADSLRLSGKPADAKPEYAKYLELSDFDSKLAGQLNYYVIGSLIGFGRRKHAAQHDIWKDLRSLAYFGLCDCDRMMSQLDSAIQNCQRALAYDSEDPYAHFALGVSYMLKANNTNNVADLVPALKHLNSVVAIDPNLEQADLAKKNIETIRKALGQL